MVAGIIGVALIGLLAAKIITDKNGEPKCCKGCGNYIKHCICGDLTESERFVRNLLNKYNHKTKKPTRKK